MDVGWLNRFLTAHQHHLGYLVPLLGSGQDPDDCCMIHNLKVSYRRHLLLLTSLARYLTPLYVQLITVRHKNFWRGLQIRFGSITIINWDCEGCRLIAIVGISCVVNKEKRSFGPSVCSSVRCVRSRLCEAYACSVQLQRVRELSTIPSAVS